MNNKGFTLVEVLVVIVLLGLIIGIAVPNVLKTGNKAKERTLLTKVNNIEKAAVLYGQDHRDGFVKVISSETNKTYCFEGTNLIQNCYYFNQNVTVKSLAQKKINNRIIVADSYIEFDEVTNARDNPGELAFTEGIVKNPTDESKSLNECHIQIYKKYGKIYAVYTDKTKGSDCWVQ